MLIDPIASLLKRCPYCGGMGCWRCLSASENAQQMRQQQEAAQFIMEYLKSIGEPEDTPITENIFLLVMNAIEQGKATVRRELHEERREEGNRFGFIELEANSVK